MPKIGAMLTPMVRTLPKDRVWSPVTAFGETKTRRQWKADSQRVAPEMMLWNRLEDGWDSDDAIGSPTNRRIASIWRAEVILSSGEFIETVDTY